MREKKYRVYNKTNRIMEYYKFHDSKNIENTKNLVIMQNTGYKDAKNKDIFEGDIVYLFGINNGQMNIMVIGDIKKIPDEIVYRSPHLMEAMGDVYQNQDLIHSHFRCLKNDEVNIRWANKCGKIGRQNADLRVEKLKLTKDRLISELKKLDPELSKQALVSYNQIFCEKCRNDANKLYDRLIQIGQQIFDFKLCKNCINQIEEERKFLLHSPKRKKIS